jgi:hypothetical protein
VVDGQVPARDIRITPGPGLLPGPRLLWHQ